MNIKPGSYPNSINLGSNGVIPVAVLTTPLFDAKDVDVSSVTFAGARPVKSSFEDVDGNGDMDLLLHFDTQSLKLSPTDTSATLIGQSIKGMDSIKIVPDKKTSFLYNFPAFLYGLFFEK